MASLYFHLAGATHRDTLDARLILEPWSRAVIAERKDPEHVKALTDYLEQSKMTIVDSPPTALEDFTDEEQQALGFHAMVMGMAGNPVISLLARFGISASTERGRVPIRPGTTSRSFTTKSPGGSLTVSQLRPSDSCGSTWRTSSGTNSSTTRGASTNSPHGTESRQDDRKPILATQLDVAESRTRVVAVHFPVGRSARASLPSRCAPQAGPMHGPGDSGGRNRM